MSVLNAANSRALTDANYLRNINDGAKDLATGLGMEEESDLHPKMHKRLAAQLQKIAVMDAKMELKMKATTKAIKDLAQEVDRRQASGSGAAAAEGEEVTMDSFLQRMSASVATSMQGADEKALQSKRYKDLMKHVTTVQGEDDDDDMIIDDGNAVSLICPLTSATFKEPVKSTACNHTFEKEAILRHIKIAGKTPAACPVAGCSGKVKSANLVPDVAMQRRLRIESQTEQTGPVIEPEEIDDSLGETYI